MDALFAMGTLAEALVTVGRSVELSMLIKVTVTLLLGLTSVRVARRARAREAQYSVNIL